MRFVFLVVLIGMALGCFILVNVKKNRSNKFRYMAQLTGVSPVKNQISTITAYQNLITAEDSETVQLLSRITPLDSLKAMSVSDSINENIPELGNLPPNRQMMREFLVEQKFKTGEFFWIDSANIRWWYTIVRELPGRN